MLEASKLSLCDIKSLFNLMLIYLLEGHHFESRDFLSSLVANINLHELQNASTKKTTVDIFNQFF